MNVYKRFLIDGISYEVTDREIRLGDEVVVTKVDGFYVEPQVRQVIAMDMHSESVTLDRGVDYCGCEEYGHTKVLLLDDAQDEVRVAFGYVDEEGSTDEESEGNVDTYASESYSVADVLYEYIEEMKFVHKLTLAEAVNILSSTGFLTDNQIAAAWISVAKIESTVEVPPILALEAFMNGEVVYEIEDDGGVVPLSYDEGSEFTYSKESDLEHGRVFHVSKVYAEENYGL